MKNYLICLLGLASCGLNTMEIQEQINPKEKDFVALLSALLNKKQDSDQQIVTLNQQGVNLAILANDMRNNPLFREKIINEILLIPENSSENADQVFEFLITRGGINVDEKDTISGNPLLAKAVMYDKEHLAKALIRGGAHINAVNDVGETPLFLAARKGKIKMARLLLQYQANPNIPDFAHSTPLITAAINGHTDIVKLLLNHKADPYYTDQSYRTAAEWANENGHKEIAHLIRSATRNQPKKSRIYEGEEPRAVSKKIKKDI